ncbi:MAG: phosphate acyltransferase PlsX [Fimbriimonadaceae bacterium]|nr:phosphate acyltransferase PlsX [Fimbriimonadaceae bacterium]
MGGDFAPREIVKGVMLAHDEVRAQLILVGLQDQLNALMPQRPPNVEVVHASEVIGMEDKPIEAIRKKKDNSLSRCVELVKEGRADAVVSAGNTGAATAASLLSWRQMPGVHRPAIATSMPNKHGHFLLLDAGASPDIDPEQIVEFALMGRAYAQTVLSRHEPKVHLINMGEEPGKGSSFAKQAYTLLEKFPWFAGNIEGKDLPTAPLDVVVCDAFVGNIILKTAEGIAEYIFSELRNAATANALTKVGFLPVRSKLRPLSKKLDYAEYGGSPLLGLNHLCTICHGRSNAKAIMNAIKGTDRALTNGLIEKIRCAFSEV